MDASRRSAATDADHRQLQNRRLLLLGAAGTFLSCRRADMPPPKGASAGILRAGSKLPEETLFMKFNSGIAGCMFIELTCIFMGLHFLDNKHES